jgi:YVTN family beta-propeller protein
MLVDLDYSLSIGKKSMLYKGNRYWFFGIISIVLSACSSGGDGGGGNNGGQPPQPLNNNFVTFETGQVRPLALSPDGNTLYVANTPNSTLEIYSIDNSGLQHADTVSVGMEPTAVAALGNQVWIVNHLSDSISIVDASVSPPQVVRTLLVGDEPRDIVFAGNNNQFAFITTAHRGQNGRDDTPVDAQLKEPGVGRADVWVFDTTNLGASIGGDPATVITLFGDTPRALTVSPDGNTVYAAVFLSGNQTTTIGENSLAKPGPDRSLDNVLAPDTGLILKYNGTNWADGTGSIMDTMGGFWDDMVPLSLPDYDVFEINANPVSGPPVATGVRYSGVGTVLYNMVTNPATGKVYVSNTEALNHVRFEGPGTSATTVRGHFVENRITVVDNTQATPQVNPLHLNKHIDYDLFPGTQTERDAALANPVDMVINNIGDTLYVAAFGSQKIGVFNTTELEGDTFDPLDTIHITLSSGGPSGVVLDEARNRLYVLTRFDNGLSVVDTTSNTEVSHLAMFNPEPEHVVDGRRFLYDATFTSSHGDSSCGLCHVFGDFDGLAWDLGNPDEVVAGNPNPFAVPNLLRPPNPEFHPMKGPMTTQSLRGLTGNGPMHWRGDRVGESAQPGESIELGAFKDFNVAFTGLVGRETELPEQDMQAFAEFALEITYPPNPIRALDNSLSDDEAQGRSIYLEELTTGFNPLTGNQLFRCNDCHVLNVTEGHFGTSGLSSVEGDEISQEFKIPHLRNMYQKVGKFGVSGKFADNTPFMGDQIKGFGFMHDGGMDTLDNFLSGSVFVFDVNDPVNNEFKRGQVVDFVMAMDSELAPIVGQQITLTADSGADVHSRIDLLRQRAQEISPREECDLIVKGVIDGEARGALMLADGSYQTDRADDQISDIDLRSLVDQNNLSLTFTCVPPGLGNWMGIDHDSDGIYDRDELDQGTDPLAPNT